MQRARWMEETGRLRKASLRSQVLHRPESVETQPQGSVGEQHSTFKARAGCPEHGRKCRDSNVQEVNSRAQPPMVA